MKVFKFGGASVNSLERIRNIGEILNGYRGEKLLVVISAMGKTTNALEKVVNAFFGGNKDLSLELFKKVREEHLDIARSLITTGFPASEARLRDFFTEVEW